MSLRATAWQPPTTGVTKRKEIATSLSLLAMTFYLVRLKINSNPSKFARAIGRSLPVGLTAPGK
jgi:hypothetical protein